MDKSQSNKNVTAVIVTYNSKNVIGGLLDSLQGQISDIIVVDNASSDTTISIARDHQCTPKVIALKQNIGFGCANNEAFKHINTDYALIVNPDVKVQEGCIDSLLQKAGLYKKAAIIAPVLFNDNGDYWPSYKQSVFVREHKSGQFIAPEGDMCAHVISGAVMLINMEYIKKHGGFDSDLFLFYEDDDLCMQAYQRGYQCVVTPDASAMHYQGKSSPSSAKMNYFKHWHMAWSRLRLEAKYKTKQDARNLALIHVYLYAFKGFFYKMSMHKKSSKYLGKASGALAFLLGKNASDYNSPL